MNGFDPSVLVEVLGSWILGFGEMLSLGVGYTGLRNSKCPRYSKAHIGVEQGEVGRLVGIVLRYPPTLNVGMRRPSGTQYGRRSIS